MALTVTSRGTGTHNTGATTLVPGGRSATLAAGSLGVLAIALDNQGSAGAALIAPDSWTDAKGNVWTLRQNALYDNGAASAGIEMAFYTAPITVALLTTDAGTMAWKTGVSPVAKAWTWYEVIPGAGNTVDYSTGGTIAGATAANAQVVTSSVLVGDAVIAGYFSENVAAVTGDADSTNGSWAAQQTATVGSTTSGVRIATQQKVQTTTASTQSYDVTVASQDRIAGYIMLHEVVATTLTPPTAALTTALFAPVVTASDHKSVTPTTLALATATFAPTLSTTAHQTVTPGVVAIVATLFEPTVTASDHKTVVPDTASLTTAAFAPTVIASEHQNVVPDVISLTLTPFAPSVAITAHVTATPDVTAFSTTGLEPTVTITAHQTITPDAAALDLAAFEPTVTVSDHVTVTPDLTELTLAAFEPTVTATDPQLVTPDTASLILEGFAPNIYAGTTVVTETAALSLSTFAPDVTFTANQIITPATASLTLSSFAASVSTPRTVTPATASLTLTGIVANVSVATGDELVPSPASLALMGFAPVIRIAFRGLHVGIASQDGVGADVISSGGISAVAASVSLKATVTSQPPIRASIRSVSQE